MSRLIEKYIQVVRVAGLNTKKAVDFSQAPSVALPAGTTVGGVTVVSTPITSTAAQAFAVGPNGNTTPTFNVDASIASAVTGVNIIGRTAGNAAGIVATSSATNEPLQIDAKGSGAIQLGTNSTGIVVAGRGARKTIIINTTTTAVATQNSTPTAAELLGGVIAHTSVTGAGTATIPTGANITGAISNPAVGDSFVVYYANIGTQTVTITTNTGITLYGTLAIPAGKIGVLYVTLLGGNSAAVYCTVSA